MGSSTTGGLGESIARTSKRLRADSSARKHGKAPVDTKDTSKKKKKKQRQGRGKVTDVGQVEGCTLQLEEWGSIGDPDYYKRFIVTCPFHGDKDGPCEKKRNIGPRQTQCLGEVEPKAFLGAWLRLGLQEHCNSDHVKQHPTDTEVRLYATVHGFA